MLVAPCPGRLLSGAAGLGLFLAACAPAAPASPTPTPAPAAPKPTTATAASPAAASGPSAPLVIASGANLSPTLHPYPDSASYTSTWIDAAILIWGGGDGGGGLLTFDWDTLDYRPAMATA